MSKVTPEETLLLQSIAVGTKQFITQAEGLEVYNKELIDINGADVDPNNAQGFRVTLTDKGAKYLASLETAGQASAAAAPVSGFPQAAAQPQTNVPAQPVANAPAQPQTAQAPAQPVTNAPATTQPQQAAQSEVQTITSADVGTVEAAGLVNGEAEEKSTFKTFANLPRPKSVRATGGAAKKGSKYPYKTTPIGGCFFVGNSAFKGNNAHRSMLSNVAIQNNKHKIPKQVGWNVDGSPQYQILMKNGEPVLAKDKSNRFVQIRLAKFSCVKIDANTIPGQTHEAGTLVYRDALSEDDVHLVNPKIAPTPEQLAAIAAGTLTPQLTAPTA